MPSNAAPFATPASACELCGRGGLPLTRHHLIPRTRHPNKRNKRLFSRTDVRERLAMLCRACHSMCHSVLTEKQMETQYNTLAALASHPEIARFVDWVRQKPPGFQPRVRKSQGSGSRIPRPSHSPGTDPWSNYNGNA